jgi:hypothetical protein
MLRHDVHSINVTEEDGTVSVYFSAVDLSEWLRSTKHAEHNQPVLHAVADMIDCCALDALTQS